MTKKEALAFNEMLMKIVKSSKKKFVPTGEGEFTAMIPVGEVLAHLRAFTNFVKSENEESSN